MIRFRFAYLRPLPLCLSVAVCMCRLIGRIPFLYWLLSSSIDLSSGCSPVCRLSSPFFLPPLPSPLHVRVLPCLRACMYMDVCSYVCSTQFLSVSFLPRHKYSWSCPSLLFSPSSSSFLTDCNRMYLFFHSSGRPAVLQGKNNRGQKRQTRQEEQSSYLLVSDREAEDSRTVREILETNERVIKRGGFSVCLAACNEERAAMEGGRWTCESKEVGGVTVRGYGYGGHAAAGS
mmetsp:Transcript_52437/g.102626  ORF Transcript_52437/g.102626 Transcript_52437/m.102626 type:complete len:232 (-) Transcript_52437:224-919(-)